VLDLTRDPGVESYAIKSNCSGSTVFLITADFKADHEESRGISCLAS